MVRLAVTTPDSPPLSTTTSSGAAQQVITQSQTNNNNNSAGSVNNSYVHQTETVAPSTSSPIQASVSPSQMQPTSQALPLSTLSSQITHHMPPPYHTGANGIHDNGHHHNGGTLYLGAAYANEFYPGAEAPHGTAYFIPPELCPAHTQLCTAVHPEYGKQQQYKEEEEDEACIIFFIYIFPCSLSG